MPHPCRLSTRRANSLIVILSFAQFVDIFNSSAFLAAIPLVSLALGLTGSTAVWLVSSYQVTFSSFFLLSGRLSDVFYPERVFMLGLVAFGSLSLISGFMTNKIAFLILRAIIGIAAASLIPSALSLITYIYPNPAQQERALLVFNGNAAIANISGLILGAVFVQLVSWRWILWFQAAVSLSIALAFFILYPRDGYNRDVDRPHLLQLDWIGICLMTSSLVLFILGVSSGPSYGWRSAIVLAPLVLSIVGFGLFAVWEHFSSSEYAAIPRKIWHNPGVIVLAIVGLLPSLWWTIVFFAFTVLWQETYHWTPLSVAVRFLPIGIPAILAIGISDKLGKIISRKWLMLGGLVFVVVGTALLPFADRPEFYWRFAFPSFFIGTMGVAIVFSQGNISIVQRVPPSLTGTAGAIWNTALQAGSAVGTAAISSLQAAIDEKNPGPFGYNGRAAGFWLLFGLSVGELLILLFFLHDDSRTSGEDVGGLGENRSSRTGCDHDGLSHAIESLETIGSSKADIHVGLIDTT